jgi:hypothetical protein
LKTDKKFSSSTEEKRKKKDGISFGVGGKLEIKKPKL